jgi:hypothetical protein
VSRATTRKVYLLETTLHHIIVFNQQRYAKVFVTMRARLAGWTLIEFQEVPDSADLNIQIGVSPNRMQHYGWINEETMYGADCGEKITFPEVPKIP